MNKTLNLIRGRKSVRTFDGRQLSREHIEQLKDYSRSIKNPFGIPVEFVLMDAKKNGLSSPVLTGEELYVAGKVEKRPYAEVAFGYSFEKLLLYAWSLGIGSVMMGDTVKKDIFEYAAGVKAGQIMPCVSPLGYPAVKRSLKDLMMRKGIGSDNRIPSDRLFFNEEWGQALSPAGELRDILEMVRWAPSSVNKQPWRIIYKDGVYHFYEKKDNGFDQGSAGDMQKIDLGIALCHFVMGMEEQGIASGISVKDPGIAVPPDAEYIASVRPSAPISALAS